MGGRGGDADGRGKPLGFLTWAINLDHPKFFPGSKILEIHFASKIARRVETQLVSKTQAEIMVKLRAMFGQSIPDPINILVTNWTHNPLTYGSYSWWPMNYTGEQWEAMRRPEGRLFFAGEHTYDNYGFLHAALQSGEETAKAVYEVLKESGELPTRRRRMRFSTTRHAATRAPDTQEKCKGGSCGKGGCCYNPKYTDHYVCAARGDVCCYDKNREVIPLANCNHCHGVHCDNAGPIPFGAGATQFFDKGPSAEPSDLARSPQVPLPSMLAWAAVVASISLLGVVLRRRGRVQGGWQTMEEGAEADAALPIVTFT